MQLVKCEHFSCLLTESGDWREKTCRSSWRTWTRPLASLNCEIFYPSTLLDAMDNGNLREQRRAPRSNLQGEAWKAATKLGTLSKPLSNPLCILYILRVQTWRRHVHPLRSLFLLHYRLSTFCCSFSRGCATLLTVNATTTTTIRSDSRLCEPPWTAI